MDTKTKKQGQAPEAKFRAGQITATIWPRQIEMKGKQITLYNTQISKNIKIDDEWKAISSFDLNDLPKVELVTRQAYEYIATKKKTGDVDDD